MKLSGKKALVTGSGRGIGLGCALALAEAGADLVLNDRPGSPDLVAAAEQVRQFGRKCEPVEADAHSRGGCEELVAKAVDALGGIDILISNPAVSKRGGFLDYDPADFERVVNGTLVAGFHVAQLVARQMVAQARGGKIVFISSVQALMPYARSAPYNAAKAGLNHMAMTIAVELSAHRINVNVIEPGWIDTPGERKTFSEEEINRVGPTLPWGRLGKPADIGQAAAFLSSPEADYITGAILRVDGGFWFKDAR
jgi:glucose 1-dehydrogenase